MCVMMCLIHILIRGINDVHILIRGINDDIIILIRGINDVFNTYFN